MLTTNSSSVVCKALRPKIWIRVGNASTDQIASVLDRHHDEIARFHADTEEALLVID